MLLTKLTAHAKHRLVLTFSAIFPGNKWQNPPIQEIWPGSTEEGQQIFNGVFEFCGERAIFSEKDFWQSKTSSPLFLRILHSFEWLRALKALSSFPENRGAARRYIKHWIHHNKKWHPISWAPNVVGQRIASWISLFDFFGSSADDDFLDMFFSHLYRQLRYLNTIALFSPKKDLDIQTIKGLLMGKIAFNHSIKKITGLLKVYLQLHLHQDGTPKSRSPMAQLILLRDLIDIRLWLKSSNAEIPPTLSQAIGCLSDAIRFFRLGDGALAPFQNSLEGSAALIDLILSQAETSKQALHHLAEAGFYRAKQDKAILIFDTGSLVMPPGLKDDRLGFEFGYGRSRIITNGTRPLQSDLLINQASPALKLSSTVLFFNPKNNLLQDSGPTSLVDISPWSLMERHEKILSAEWAQTIQNHRLKHQRTLTLLNHGKELKCEERLSGIEKGSALIRVNFHPTLRTTTKKGSRTILLMNENQQKWRLDCSKEGELTLHKSTYYGIDNKELSCSQAIIKVHFQLPQVIVKWTLRLLDPSPSQT